MTPLYIIKCPYSGKYFKPLLVHSLEYNYGYHYLKEYPERDDDDFYSVQVSQHDTYTTELEAYVALTDVFMYELKRLVDRLC